MKSWHKDKIICRTSSRHNHLLEVAIEDGRTVLNTENGNYSYGNLHIIFNDVFRQEHIAERQFSNILLLGMGAGSVIELLRSDFGQKNKITAVEIDEEIISLARQHFNLNSYQQLEVVHADAYDFVMNNTQIYDLIVIDLYIDLEVPTKFETEDFVKLLMNITNKGSKIIFNKVVQSNKQKKQFVELIKWFEKASPTHHYTLLGFNKMLICDRI